MPSGRISKRDQETILFALTSRKVDLEDDLRECMASGDAEGVYRDSARVNDVILAIHTIRDTMETYEPCANCGGDGYVFDGTEPVECPSCLGHAEQRTCPQCETALVENLTGNWFCVSCGWSSIKVVTK